MKARKVACGRTLMTWGTKHNRATCSFGIIDKLVGLVGDLHGIIFL